MRIIKSIFYVSLLSLISTLGFAASGDLSGSYKCSVFDPKNNSHYTENIAISKTSDTYRIQVYQANPALPYILGTGVVSGNALGVISWEPSSTWVGTALFAIKPDGSLDGTWATSATNLVGTETCTKS